MSETPSISGTGLLFFVVELPSMEKVPVFVIFRVRGQILIPMTVVVDQRGQVEQRMERKSQVKQR